MGVRIDRSFAVGSVLQYPTINLKGRLWARDSKREEMLALAQ